MVLCSFLYSAIWAFYFVNGFVLLTVFCVCGFLSLLIFSYLVYFIIYKYVFFITILKVIGTTYTHR